jgi:hypothetical protein
MIEEHAMAHVEYRCCQHEGKQVQTRTVLAVTVKFECQHETPEEANEHWHNCEYHSFHTCKVRKNE